jgi:hypothetical protein
VGLIFGTRGAASRLVSRIIPHTDVCGTDIVMMIETHAIFVELNELRL